MGGRGGWFPRHLQTHRNPTPLPAVAASILAAGISQGCGGSGWVVGGLPWWQWVGGGWLGGGGGWWQVGGSVVAMNIIFQSVARLILLGSQGIDTDPKFY